MKKIIAVMFLMFSIFLTACVPVPLSATELIGEEDSGIAVDAPSAILMEASTGNILYEKNAHERLRPASVTKIMTLLLIFDALEAGQIQKTDVVTVSENAAGMGGSQVYLEVNETQTVEDLIKCISIASANDACVAMAEFIAGTEEAFVAKMNERAQSLGMSDTTFVNSCGLEAEGHLTSAHDIALMSRELITAHPDIFNYCTIWMDTITHTTKKGTSEFGLTNTNKLIRYYSYATGLKTGYTSQSKYCLSATAEKDDVALIAVVMAEESPTIRNKDAVALLNYGFANCTLYTDENTETLPALPIKKGTVETVPIEYDGSFSTVLSNVSSGEAIEKKLSLPESVDAPVTKGDIAGKALYLQDGREIGSVNIRYSESVPALTYKDCIQKVLLTFFLSDNRMS